MSKARNLKRDAVRFSYLARTDSAQFRRVWRNRVQGWLYEIQNRAKTLRNGERVTAQAVTSEELLVVERRAERLGIFDLLDRANALLAACGKDVERLVGAETRDVLSAECAKSFASVCDRRLYRVVQFSRMKR